MNKNSDKRTYLLKSYLFDATPLTCQLKACSGDKNFGSRQPGTKRAPNLVRDAAPLSQCPPGPRKKDSSCVTHLSQCPKP
jgi:hypothetical protein